jgi:hypothetical protein
MGELTVKHDFKDSPGVKIRIFKFPGGQQEPDLENCGDTATFQSDSVEKIIVTIKKGNRNCYVKCPSSSNFTFKSEKEMKVGMTIIGKLGGHYLKIPSPLSMWEFTFNIPVKGEDPDPVTIGDNPP